MNPLLYVVSLLPSVLYSIPMWVAYLLWGTKLHFESGVLFFELKKTSWPIRTWYKNWSGTTLGHMVMTRPNPSKKLSRHEQVHVEQFQGNSLLGLLVGTFCLLFTQNLALSLLLWAAIPGMQYACAGLVAVMKGENFYRGNVNEEAAYAVEMREFDKLSCARTPLAWLSITDNKE